MSKFDLVTPLYPEYAERLKVPSMQDLPMASSRGEFYPCFGIALCVVTRQILLTIDVPPIYVPRNIPGLQVGNCPGEIVVFAHGWSTPPEQAYSSYASSFTLLFHNNYKYPLVLFDWDAGIPILDQSWDEGNTIAFKNGQNLGKFILDYKNKCPQDNIRLVGHSMGTRVLISAIDWLHNNLEWKQKNFKIATVHLTGAAVNDEEVSMNQDDCSKNPHYASHCVGESIKDEVFITLLIPMMIFT